ncbi:MAG: hypothetical protein H7A34_06540 [bacterium]|nr:hypothetical protein [bacterium]
MLEKASYICFLGFGYDDVNLKRLGFDGTKIYNQTILRHESRVYPKAKKIYGTAFGLKHAERNRISKWLCPIADRCEKRLCFGDEKQGIVDFLRDKFDIL